LFYKSAACQKFKDLDLAKHKTEKKKQIKKKLVVYLQVKTFTNIL